MAYFLGRRGIFRNHAGNRSYQYYGSSKRHKRYGGRTMGSRVYINGKAYKAI